MDMYNKKIGFSTFDCTLHSNWIGAKTGSHRNVQNEAARKGKTSKSCKRASGMHYSDINGIFKVPFRN